MQWLKSHKGSSINLQRIEAERLKHASSVTGAAHSGGSADPSSSSDIPISLTGQLLTPQQYSCFNKLFNQQV